MKSTELHTKIRRSGWHFLKQEGTSYVYYEKNGVIICVPFHGSKEVPTGTLHKIMKIAGLK